MAEDHQGGCAAMAGPSEAHKELDPFVGTFKATVKIWMGLGNALDEFIGLPIPVNVAWLSTPATFWRQGPVKSRDHRASWSKLGEKICRRLAGQTQISRVISVNHNWCRLG